MRRRSGGRWSYTIGEEGYGTVVVVRSVVIWDEGG